MIEFLIDEVLAKIKAEVLRATSKHGPMRSSHEAYAVLLEEVDELWDAVKTNDKENAATEVVQVGAMAVRYYVDVVLKDARISMGREIPAKNGS